MVIVLLLTSVYFVIKIVGLVIGSLALISDAGHMLIDVAGLGMALLAISFTQNQRLRLEPMDFIKLKYFRLFKTAYF